MWLPVEQVWPLNFVGCAGARRSSSDTFSRLAVLMMNTNLILDSDVDDPVVEDNMVDDGLFVGLFVLDVDDSSCKLTVVYVYCHAQVLRPCHQ